jgi:hypothetical protein
MNQIQFQDSGFDSENDIQMFDEENQFVLNISLL